MFYFLLAHATILTVAPIFGGSTLIVWNREKWAKPLGLVLLPFLVYGFAFLATIRSWLEQVPLQSRASSYYCSRDYLTGVLIAHVLIIAGFGVRIAVDIMDKRKQRQSAT